MLLTDVCIIYKVRKLLLFFILIFILFSVMNIYIQQLMF